MLLRVVLSTLLAGLLLAGCAPYRVQVPGMLDLRPETETEGVEGAPMERKQRRYWVASRFLINKTTVGEELKPEQDITYRDLVWVSYWGPLDMLINVGGTLVGSLIATAQLGQPIPAPLFFLFTSRTVQLTGTVIDASTPTPPWVTPTPEPTPVETATPEPTPEPTPEASPTKTPLDIHFIPIWELTPTPTPDEEDEESP